MSRRVGVFFVMGVLLSGCFGAGWREFSDGLQRHRGVRVDEMVERFGAPDKSVDLPGSARRVAYTWKIYDRGGAYACRVTAIAGKEDGVVAEVKDNCRRVGR